MNVQSDIGIPGRQQAFPGCCPAIHSAVTYPGIHMAGKSSTPANLALGQLRDESCVAAASAVPSMPCRRFCRSRSLYRRRALHRAHKAIERAINELSSLRCWPLNCCLCSFSHFPRPKLQGYHDLRSRSSKQPCRGHMSAMLCSSITVARKSDQQLCTNSLAPTLLSKWPGISPSCLPTIAAGRGKWPLSKLL